METTEKVGRPSKGIYTKQSRGEWMRIKKNGGMKNNGRGFVRDNIPL
jgi:hypothetical protein